MDAKSTGEFIAALRRERGMTQKELADAIAVTDKAVSRWETGKGYPDVETLAPLAETLGVTVGELLAGERDVEAEEEGKTENERDDSNTDANPENAGAPAAPPVYIYGVPPRVVGELYRKTVSAERRARRTRIALIAAALVVGSLLAGFVAYKAVGFVSREFVRDKNCVVAADYSSITYNGQRYVPVKLYHDVIDDGDLLVNLASVEGQPRRLDFNTWFSRGWSHAAYCYSVYSVPGAEDSGLIKLVGGDGEKPEWLEFYCVESMADSMEKYDCSASLDVYVIGEGGFKLQTRRICMALAAMSPDDAVTLKLKRAWYDVDYLSYVHVEDPWHIFREDAGEIVEINGDYYYLSNDPSCVYYNEFTVIPFPDSLDEDIEALFGGETTN